MNRRYIQSTVVIVLTLALHVALWSLLRVSSPRQVAPQQTVRMTVLQIPMVNPPAPVEPLLPPGREADVAQRPRQRAKVQSSALAPRSTSVPSPIEATPSEAVASPSPASASAAAPSLLDTQGTRRAIREAARQPSLAERWERAGTDTQRPDQRLGNSIAEGAKGDCLKGEYAGAGLGLLSLPFLAVAVLGDHCRR